MNNREAYEYVVSGKHETPPASAPDKMKELINVCLSQESYERPPFKQV